MIIDGFWGGQSIIAAEWIELDNVTRRLDGGGRYLEVIWSNVWQPGSCPPTRRCRRTVVKRTLWSRINVAAAVGVAAAVAKATRPASADPLSLVAKTWRIFPIGQGVDWARWLVHADGVQDGRRRRVELRSPAAGGLGGEGRLDSANGHDALYGGGNGAVDPQLRDSGGEIYIVKHSLSWVIVGVVSCCDVAGEAEGDDD